MTPVRSASSQDNAIFIDVLRRAGMQVSQLDYLQGLPSRSSFIAEADGAAIGVIEGRFDAGDFPGVRFGGAPHPRAWIDKMGVVPERQRERVGFDLVHTFVIQAQLAGCRYVGLTVDESTDPTDRRAFFQRCGFEFIDDDPDNHPEANMAAEIAAVLNAT